MKPDSNKILLIDDGEPEFYTYHGITLCLRSQSENMMHYGFFPFYPEDGFLKEVEKIIKSVMAESKNITSLKEDTLPFKDDIYPIVFAVYIELKH